MTKPRAPFGASLIVLSSLFYASYGIWTALMGNFFGGYTASALRSALVLLMLAPLALLYRQFEAVNWRRDWRYLTLILKINKLSRTIRAHQDAHKRQRIIRKTCYIRESKFNDHLSQK